MFCPKCKSILKPIKENDNVILKCPVCNIKANSKKLLILKDKAKVIPEKHKRSTGVADESHNILAVHNHICSKCGYNKAEIIEKGIWYSDEDQVVIYKCGKCGNTELEADKVT